MTDINNQKGYTMLETIMYISLLIVLGGVLAGYAHTVLNRYKTGRTAQQILDLKKAIVYFTAADENYGNLSALEMSKHNSVPLDMRAPDNRIRHALNGEVNIGPATELMGENADSDFMFYVTFNGIYQGACVELLTQGQFYGDGSEMDTLIVNNTHAWRYEYSFYDTQKISQVVTLTPASNGITNAVSISLTISDALAACTQKQNNSITWIFS